MNDQGLLVEATARLLDDWCGRAMHEGNVCAVLGCSSHTAHLFDTVTADLCKARIADVYLDLSRPAVRDHVKRRVAGRRWYRDLDESTLTWLHAPRRTVYRWAMLSDRGEMVYMPQFAPKHEGNVPELASVRFDGRRLPDGSRRIDAVALAHVARKLFHG